MSQQQVAVGKMYVQQVFFRERRLAPGTVFRGAARLVNQCVMAQVPYRPQMVRGTNAEGERWNVAWKERLPGGAGVQR